MADVHGSTNLSHLIQNFGIGKIFYVSNSTAYQSGGATPSNSNEGTDPKLPCSTIAGALAKCVASRGDVVVVGPGHAETLTAALAVSVSGVSVIGVGNGNLKPTLSVNGAVDCVNMSGANSLLQNIAFRIVTTDAATAFVNVSAAGVTLRGLSGICSATSVNVVDVITLASGADDCLIEDCYFYNSVVAVNSFLSIEAAVARLRVKNFYAFGDTATAGIIDAATATQMILENVNIGTVGTTQPGAILDSNPTGLALKSSFAGTSTTLANNAALGTGLRLFDIKVLEETNGSAQGALIPAVDAD